MGKRVPTSGHDAAHGREKPGVQRLHEYEYQQSAEGRGERQADQPVRALAFRDEGKGRLERETQARQEQACPCELATRRPGAVIHPARLAGSWSAFKAWSPSCYDFQRDMKPDRRPSLLAFLTTPHASSPRRWLFVSVFIAIILALGAFGLLP
jgi:hypothetical protein